jgi:hypothetical protein
VALAPGAAPVLAEGGAKGQWCNGVFVPEVTGNWEDVCDFDFDGEDDDPGAGQNEGAFAAPLVPHLPPLLPAERVQPAAGPAQGPRGPSGGGGACFDWRKMPSSGGARAAPAAPGGG